MNSSECIHTWLYYWLKPLSIDNMLFRLVMAPFVVILRLNISSFCVLQYIWNAFAVFHIVFSWHLFQRSDILLDYFILLKCTTSCLLWSLKRKMFQWRFSNLNVSQNHMEGLLNHRWLDLSPEHLIQYVWMRPENLHFQQVLN